MLKVITWNVNSIKMREERTLNLLKRYDPDILCLQELKCIEDNFPSSLKEAGYNAYLLGQKTYNGVAVLSKKESIKITKKLTPEDSDARWIGAHFKNLSVYSAYIPNGQAVGSEKYAYKLKWFEALLSLLKKDHKPTDSILICGDFNVAPKDQDVHDPVLWHEKILCSHQERDALQKILDWGLVDCFRAKNPASNDFSWWDYRALAFPLNHGLRIDFILATAPLYDHCKKAEILRDERKGEKPSDHAPVYCEFTASS